MNESRKVRWFLRMIVMLNLLTLAGVFLFPRVSFIVQHPQMTRDEFLTTPGTRDLPNFKSRAFDLAFVLRSATPKTARLFLPPAGEGHTDPSALHRVLLPRTLYFGKTGDYRRFRDAAPLLTQSWLVASPAWEPEGCAGRITRPLLPDTGFVLCRLDISAAKLFQGESRASNVSQ